jgi:translation initiation factor 5A
MDVPVVKKKEYQLLSVTEDGFVSLMDLETCETKDDLRLPEGEIGDQIKQAYEKDESGILVAVTSAIGEEMILGWKVNSLIVFKISISYFFRSCQTRTKGSTRDIS